MNVWNVSQENRFSKHSIPESERSIASTLSEWPTDELFDGDDDNDDPVVRGGRRAGDRHFVVVVVGVGRAVVESSSESSAATKRSCRLLRDAFWSRKWRSSCRTSSSSSSDRRVSDKSESFRIITE
jgi:hypothetical protein